MFYALQHNPIIPIKDTHVLRTAISLATGNSKKDVINVNQILKEFENIKGQDDICEKLLDIMKREELQLFPKKSPTSLLFIGPSGVGKTELAKIMAQEMTGHQPITLNMTEYADPATINRIIGSPAGYIGSDSNAELPFDSLEGNPYAVILLDEFEKAHPAVKRLFFSIFDEGVLTDNHGKQIDFSKAIIIATTNAGHDKPKKSIGFGNESNQNTSIKELTSSFDTALLNRFNYRITFHPITTNIYKDILKHNYHKEAIRINKEHPSLKLDIDLPDDEVERLTKETYHEEFGARPIGKTIRDYIENIALSHP
jgi:ATP-dependent Clp protease ATP-binding subunit ClpA